MLPGQDSGTNQTASTTIFADPAFDNFLTNETFSAMEYPTQDLVKTEEDETTNLGFQQITQHMRREAQQQQNNMARPGQHQLHGLDHNEDNTLKQIESALAVGTAGTATLQLPTKAEPERPCTPPQQFNVCRSLHARIDMVQWLTQAQVNSQSLQTPVHIPSTSGAKKCPEAGPWSHRPSGPTSSLQATTTTTASAPQRPCDAHLPIPTTKAHWKLSCIASSLHRTLSARSAGLVPPPSFSLFPNVSTLGMDFTVKSTEYDSSHYSPMSSALTPLMSSFESSPEMTNMSLFDSMATLPDLSLPARATKLPASQSTLNLAAYPSPPKERSHRRTQSTATVEVDGINEDTGVTEDEITMYIVGPNLENKYMCTFEGCNKLFGRKENIRSHVQTHLGDRQWRCNHCHKRFVRQHDLKRHAKIHTGQKPHLCPCGNGFARHDALTRHRQRNTCIGGFGVVEGMPQSPSKRGRPKKRPDLESRRDKAAKTRERVLEKATASSVSGSSDFSAASPEMFFEELTTGSKSADNMVMIQSQETDDVLEAVNAMSPAMVEECLREMSKSSSPFSDFEENNLFGANNNAFDTTYDPTSAWLL